MTNKQYKQAQQMNCQIVSPEWLHACKASNSRADENNYPYNYNPQYSLELSNTGTSRRRLRSTATGDADASHLSPKRKLCNISQRTTPKRTPTRSAAFSPALHSTAVQTPEKTSSTPTPSDDTAAAANAMETMVNSLHLLFLRFPLQTIRIY